MQELPGLSSTLSSRLVRIADSDPMHRTEVTLDVRATNVLDAIGAKSPTETGVFEYHD